MFCKKPLKVFLFPAVNIILSILLLRAFFICGQDAIETLPVAQMSALQRLMPDPMDYLWKLNIYHAPLDKNMIRGYKDYYLNLIKVFPSLWDAYGILGYCYHYLGEDPKAIDYFIKAIARDPYYSWNYFDLAVIYLNEGRYQEAYELLVKMQHVDPQQTLKIIFTSQNIYLPLLGEGANDALRSAVMHIKSSYTISSFILYGLSRPEERQKTEHDIKNMKLEIYAF